jgi:hypothetical protein
MIYENLLFRILTPDFFVRFYIAVSERKVQILVKDKAAGIF